MPKQCFRKLDIAYEYLSVASALYFQAHYFPALHLAGAAEEILQAVMEKRNERPKRPGPGLRFVPDQYRPISRDQIELAMIMNPRLRDKSQGHVYKLLYRAKNSAKH